MKRKLQLALCGMAVACCIGSGAFAASMDFEGIGLGTRYGGGEGDNPGDVVLTQGGIDMSVETFYYGSYDGFNYAEIGGQFAGFFPTTPLETNNISVKFDFSNLGFDVTFVTLEYQEFGGIDNFAVNGHTIYELTSLLDIPINVAPGVVAGVTDSLIALASDGSNINSFQIGGQELAIDTIVAVPEPAALVLLALGAALGLRRRRLASS